MTKRRLYILGLIAIPVIIFGGIYANYRLGLRPVAASGEPRDFTVAAGENAPTIAQHLVDAGLLRNRNAFVSYVNFHGLRARLKTGRYSVAPTLSGNAIAELLAGGRTLSHRLMVPEGYTLKQIEASAASIGISKADFTAALAAPHDQAFLAGKPAGVSLEGYLFPDSYQTGAATTAASLVGDMLDNFGKRVGPEYAQAFAAEGLSPHQGLTMASIVEREVSIPADRPIVAQIFLKRLKLGQSLGSDVTTHYAADLLGVAFNTELNSPYNTRRVVGLPPGPICSPGLSAMDAVAHPAGTDFLYFLSGKDGKTHFAKTYAEHQRNIVKYL
jgi:UPF0755 protein